MISQGFETPSTVGTSPSSVLLLLAPVLQLVLLTAFNADGLQS